MVTVLWTVNHETAENNSICFMNCLANTFQHGTVNGRNRRGRQKKRWEDSIKEWTGMDFASSTRAAEDRTKLKGVVAKSSVVPQRPGKVMG